MDTFTSKLGKTRHGERSRIWIEGKRLVAAGFVKGLPFYASWSAATLTLTLVPSREPYETRTISGKGDSPIIDITGASVAETFGATGTHVRVTYGQGVITIRRA